MYSLLHSILPSLISFIEQAAMSQELTNHWLLSTVLEADISSFVLVVSNAAIFKQVNPDFKKLSNLYKSWSQQVVQPELEPLAHGFLLFSPNDISDSNLSAQA